MDVTLTSCCAGRLYHCPQTRRIECPLHADNPCCGNPDRHVRLADIAAAYRPGNGPSEQVLPHLVRYLTERTEMGARKYGEPLSTFNGRNPAVDLFEELIDLVQYHAQEFLERYGSLPDGAGAHGRTP